MKRKQQQNQSTSTVKKDTKWKLDEPVSWFAQDASKRWTEIFFLKWSVGWILLFAGIVASKIYLWFGDLEFMCLGITVSFPYFFYPLFFGGKVHHGMPITEQYWFKANIWIGIFSFVGNYLWTHYFFQVLGATYDFPVKITLNRVPVFLYLVTHAYFCFYHTITTITLRTYFNNQTVKSWSRPVHWVVTVLVIFLMSYFTAFMEAFTISSVPYYIIEDRMKMYLIGSAFYGIYFYVSFPMYYRLDEYGKKKRYLRSSLILLQLRCWSPCFWISGVYF